MYKNLAPEGGDDFDFGEYNFRLNRKTPELEISSKEVEKNKLPFQLAPAQARVSPSPRRA